MNNLLKIKPEFLKNSIKSTNKQINNIVVCLNNSNISSSTSTSTSTFNNNNSNNTLNNINNINNNKNGLRHYSNDSTNSNSYDSSSQQQPQQQPQQQQQQQPIRITKYPTAELFKAFSKSLIDPLTGDIDFLKIKDKIDELSMEHRKDKLEFLFTWSTKVMKTKNILILEMFLYQFRKLKMSTFIQALQYINENDIPQNIFIFNISLYYYQEMGMMDEARKLTDLLLSMGSQLPEKAYLAIINTFSSDYSMLKRCDALIKSDGVSDDKTRLLNELFIIFIESHRDLESALSLLDIIEGEQLQVYFNTMVSLLQFFTNNNMQDHAVSLLKNIGLKYPTWFSSKKFVERIAPTIYSLQKHLTEFIEHADSNDYTSVNLYNILINTFSVNKNTKAVVELYNKMIKKFAPNPVTIKSLILLSVKEDNVEQCLYWFSILKGLGFYLNSKLFIYFIRFFIQKKQYQVVEELVADYKVNKALWTPMATGYIVYYINYIKADSELKKEIDPIFLSLFEESIEFRQQATDQIIQLCLLDDLYKDAENWYNSKSIKYGISPGADSYLNFISYHRIRNEYQQADYWIKKMKNEIGQDITDSNDQIFDYYHRFYEPKNKVFKSNYKERSLSRIEINEKLQTNPNDAIKLVFSLLEKRDSTINEEFFVNIIRKLANMGRIDDVKKIYETSLVCGYIPTFQYTYAFLSNYYRRAPYSKYLDYITNPPLGAFKKDFEKSHLCILASLSLRKCLKLLNNEKRYYQYTESKIFLNGLLSNLVNMNQPQKANQLIESMLDKGEKVRGSIRNLTFDDSVLESYLIKFIENENHIPFINKLLNYFQINSIHFNIPLIKAAMASNLLIEGKIQESYKLYKQVLTSGYGNIATFELGIRIYSKIYPIPPLDNLLKWNELRVKFNEQYGVNVKAMYRQYFKSLIEIGRSDLVRQEIGKKNFDFNNHSFETVSLIFKVYKDQPEMILKLATLLKNKQYTIKDKVILELIREAHSSHPKINPNEIKEILNKVKTFNYIEDFKFTDLESKLLEQIINMKQNHIIYNQNNNNHNNNEDDDQDNNNNNYNNNYNNNNNNQNNNNYNNSHDHYINRNINRNDILLV